MVGPVLKPPSSSLLHTFFLNNFKLKSFLSFEKIILLVSLTGGNCAGSPTNKTFGIFFCISPSDYPCDRINSRISSKI